MYKTKALPLNAPKFCGREPYGFTTQTAADTWIDPKSGYFTDEKIIERWNNLPASYNLLGSSVHPNQRGVLEFSSTEYKRPTVNFCTNIKTNLLEYKPVETVLTRARYYGPYQSCYIRNYYVQELPGVVYLPKKLDFLADTQSAARRAWWIMQPRFQSDSNILLSLIELKDFRETATILTKLTKKASAFGLRALARKKPGKELSISNSLESAEYTVASGILFNNLALQPLLSDIAHLIVTLQTTVEDARATFNDMGTKPHTSHHTEVLSSTHTFTAMSTNFVLGYSSKQIFVASMERTYSVKPTSAYEDFKKYYGLNLTMETMYNLIPFSFLADYILTISKSIKAMEVDKTVNLNLINYYESILNKSHWGAHLFNNTIRFTNDGQSCKYATTPEFCSGYSSSYYNRYRANPNFGPALPNIAKYRDVKLINTMAILRTMF